MGMPIGFAGHFMFPEYFALPLLCWRASQEIWQYSKRVFFRIFMARDVH